MSKPSIRLKKLRRTLGLTQKELGDKLGFPWYLIKNIETEKTRLSLEVAENLYKNLSININWILSGEGNMFLERDFQEVTVKSEEEEMVPEVRDIVYGLKDTREKIMSLNKILLRENKSTYSVSSSEKRRYPLISLEGCRKNTTEKYIELPEEWNIEADFVINTEGKSFINNDLPFSILCFVREVRKLKDGDIAILKTCRNEGDKIIFSKVKLANGLTEFQNISGENPEDFEIKGIAVFWMSDYRT